MKRKNVFDAHLQQGTSMKNLQHMAQLVKADKFQRFDYGATINTLKYGQPQPPQINLNCLQTPLHIVGAQYD